MAWVSWFAYRHDGTRIGTVRAEDKECALLEAFLQWGSAVMDVQSVASAHWGPPEPKPCDPEE